MIECNCGANGAVMDCECASQTGRPMAIKNNYYELKEKYLNDDSVSPELKNVLKILDKMDTRDSLRIIATLEFLFIKKYKYEEYVYLAIQGQG